MIRQRCAIYTRKSTEEGLEQEFNSLDAQREACAAYILSQKHEGWAELLDRYDDGGFSGGTMDRPGLRQLLADVAAGRIDVIVVYKVDRLTRSLSDFAKMVDLFDGAGVSFVSVTQAFNTTSSMGRLTLNVLLSFAQFEREVTAERIRDKIAASKRKGMWMGGAVPLGYDAKDKALMVNPDEAGAIRTIFDEYLATGSVRRLTSRLTELGIVSKQRTDRFRRVSGGTSFSRGALYNILRNPIYIGKVRHKDELFEGVHEAIVDSETWWRAQAMLADHGGRKLRAARRSAKRLLDDVLFDSMGRAMRTTYASKSLRREGTIRTKRYWYYTSKPSCTENSAAIERLPAKEMERLVLGSLRERLCDKDWLADQARKDAEGDAVTTSILRAAEAWVTKLATGDSDVNTLSLAELIKRIDARKDHLRIWLNLHASLDADASSVPLTSTFDVPFRKRQNGCTRPIIIVPEDAPRPDTDLIALVADARRWAHELLDGQVSSIQQITEREGLRSGSVSRILPLAWLAPDITTAILEGRQPTDLSAKTLRNLRDLPLDWVQQRAKLGFPPL